MPPFLLSTSPAIGRTTPRMELQQRLNKIASDFRLNGAQTAGLAVAACVLLDLNNDVALDGRDLVGTMARLRAVAPEVDTAMLDIDPLLEADSDVLVATQAAVKAYVDAARERAIADVATSLASGSAVIVLPSEDPEVEGAIWNDGGVVAFSEGPGLGGGGGGGLGGA